MLGVIISAVSVIMVGYLMVGFAGYLAFPTMVQGNVLKSFSENDILMQVGAPEKVVQDAE
jgi:amino acid permease